MCERAVKEGKQRFISSSGGNAGIAVAYAGRHLSIPVVVVVPKTTASISRQMIERENAQLIVHGASWQEANEFALSMTGPVDAFVHPFDNPILWKGHAGMIDEVAAAAPEPDAVVVAVGGGGLLAGVVEGLHRNGWPDVPVIAVETFGASSLAQSVAAGKRIPPLSDRHCCRLPRRQTGLRTVFRVDEGACRSVHHRVGRERRRILRAIPWTTTVCW